jgi:hypothetical protein
VQAFILIPAVTSVDNDFGARLFAATVAVWLLFYFGLIVRVRTHFSPLTK